MFVNLPLFVNMRNPQNEFLIIFNSHASERLHKGGVMVYFIATIYTEKSKDKTDYATYIEEVKPIVERYGGRYLVRTNRIISLSAKWNPERIIIIQWESREQLEACFESQEYRKIAAKRENSVDSRAIIVEEDEG